MQEVIVNQRTGNLIDGHLRCQLAAREGAKTIPVKYVDLSEEEEALVLSTLDPIAAMATTDKQKLDELFASIETENADVLKMLDDIAEKERLEYAKRDPVDAEPQIDRAAELNEKWQVVTGDLWHIGEHKLLCGDSTKREDVERVMAGEKAELCLTDPPYATGGKSEDYDVFVGDLPNLINGFLPLAKDVSSRILLTPGNAHQFLYPKPDWVLAWFVQAGVGANPWGFTFWNAIFAYGKDPYLARGLGSRPDAFVKTEASDKTEHSTSKPVGVWSWILERGSVDNGEIIFDPFIGSGTTMVACQNLNRKCRGIEISPNYCAVILERMHTAFPELEIKRV